jgi:hypothetical protein
VTSDGNPYARFRRALVTQNLAIIQAAAAEIPKLGSMTPSRFSG